MISRQQVGTSVARIPFAIVPPALIVLIALFPAVWNQDRSVRQVMATAMVVGMVWMVIAVAIHCMAAVDDVRVDNLRERAKAELGGDMDNANADVVWAEIVNQLDADTWPDGHH